jgi:hypothetical protein
VASDRCTRRWMPRPCAARRTCAARISYAISKAAREVPQARFRATASAPLCQPWSSLQPPAARLQARCVEEGEEEEEEVQEEEEACECVHVRGSTTEAVGWLRVSRSAEDCTLHAQVALNWIICKGAIPIPGASTVKHIDDNLGALGWRLSPKEQALLEDAADALSFDFNGSGFQTTDSKFVGYGFEQWRLD